MEINTQHRALLHRIPIFSRLGEGELDLLLGGGKFKAYSKSTVVFNEGDLQDGLYVVIKGKAKAVLLDEEGRELTLSIFKDGDFFGEMAIFDENPRSATVETIEDTTFLVLTKDVVLSLLAKNPTISKTILREMSLRLREADDKIRTLAHFDVAGRIARIILDLLKKEGTVIKQKNIAYVKLPPRQDLANMIGASRETVSRVLNSLQKRGLISLAKDNIIVYNIQELA